MNMADAAATAAGGGSIEVVTPRTHRARPMGTADPAAETMPWVTLVAVFQELAVKLRGLSAHPTKWPNLAKTPADIAEAMAGTVLQEGHAPINYADARKMVTYALYDHALWMCDEVESWGPAAAPAQREKAMRWLGFVQGVSFALSVGSIDEFRAMNAPGTPPPPRKRFDATGAVIDD